MKFDIRVVRLLALSDLLEQLLSFPLSFITIQSIVYFSPWNTNYHTILPLSVNCNCKSRDETIYIKTLGFQFSFVRSSNCFYV